MKKSAVLGALCIIAGISSVAFAAEPVDKFVSKLYFHGVPYSEASKYGAKDQAILEQMLADTQQQNYWVNIVVTLGMMGDPVATDTLIQFSEANISPVTPAVYRAKEAAVTALGYIVNKSGDAKALKYLASTANGTGGASNAAWISPYHASAVARNAELAGQGMIGLALAGNKGAPALKALASQAVNKSASVTMATDNELLKAALVEQSKVASKGLDKYNADMSN